MGSSNNLKNYSSSSGNIWRRLKDYNYNNNNINIPPILSIINPHPKGRKLIEDFNKLTNNKNIENEINSIKNSHINNNNSTNNNYNISNNNFSFLTPSNNKPKKEEETEKEKEKEKEKKNDNVMENKKE